MPGPVQRAATRAHLGLKDLGLAAAVFLVALAFRGAYVAEIVRLPDFASPLVDAGYHDYCAWGLASGDWKPPAGEENPAFGTTPYFRPPLITFFLAAVFRVFGHDPLAARLLMALVGSAGCVLTFLLGKRLFGRGVGFTAGLLAASYWSLVYYDTEYREVVLLVVLFQCAVLLLAACRESGRAPTALAAGVALGLAALARPNALLFLPLAGLWLAVGLQGRRTRAAALLALAVGAALCILPVTARNARAGADAVLISSNGGINLYLGNSPLADGFSVTLPAPFPPFRSAFDHPAIVRAMERREGRPLRHSDVSALFARDAMAYVRANPGHTLALLARKAAGFWGGAEIVSEKDDTMSRRESMVLRLNPLPFAGILACAIVGLFAAGRDAASRRAGPGIATGAPALLALIAGMMGVYWLSHLPFFVTGRYRVPLVPFLLVLAAHALHRGCAAFARRDLRAGLVSAAAICALWAANSVDWSGYVYDASKGPYDRGTAWHRQGNLPEAARYLEEAVRLKPELAAARANLGLVYRGLGRPADAQRELERAAALEPTRADHAYNLALLALDRGELDHWRTGAARAFALAPADAALARTAANDLVRHGRDDEAVGFFEKALALGPGDADLQLRLGTALLRLGRHAEAATHLREAIRARPGTALAHANLGVALAALGDAPAAAVEFTEALRLDPGLTAARENLDRLRRDAPQQAR